MQPNPAGPDDEAPGLDPAVPVGERVELTAPELVARAALNRAKEAARARGLRPGARPASAPVTAGAAASGAGPSDRDPQPVSDVLARLVRDRGWSTGVSVGSLLGRWRELVGDQLADHCAPETFADKVLVVRADSSTWATQVRILAPQLLARLVREVGADVIDEVQVRGPAGPSFRRGRRAVRGSGPRDTWG